MSYYYVYVNLSLHNSLVVAVFPKTLVFSAL